MVNRPVGPPSGPPVPTEGDWLRGSLPGLSVCPVTADIRIKLASAAKSALLASLIAFLLRNEFKCLRKGRPCSLKSPAAALPLARSQQTCRGGAWPLPGDLESRRGRSDYKPTTFELKTAAAPNAKVL